jgi:hypothetical protein
MFDIHARSEAIRTEGLKETELPFDSLIVGAKVREIATFKIGTRKDLLDIIGHFFRTLPSDWIMLGLIDPSDRLFPFVGDSTGLLAVSRDQAFSEEFLDDVWLVLRSSFELQVTLCPDFPRICTDFINALACIQMLSKPPDGHC